MPDTRRDWIILAVVITLVGALWINVSRVDADGDAQAARPALPNIGHPAPDFVLVTQDGQETTLESYQGTPVILNFWATWCGPCRAEIPALDAVYQAYAGEVVVLGVNVRETPQAVSRFQEQVPFSFSVLMDSSGEVEQIYRVRALPTTYFIDERGIITGSYSGALNESTLRARIERLVN